MRLTLRGSRHCLVGAAYTRKDNEQAKMLMRLANDELGNTRRISD